ncbi:MAG: hypothetical protein AB4426_26935 [Xenococcaceae cyanobacterium]
MTKRLKGALMAGMLTLGMVGTAWVEAQPAAADTYSNNQEILISHRRRCRPGRWGYRKVWSRRYRRFVWDRFWIPGNCFSRGRRRGRYHRWEHGRSHDWEHGRSHSWEHDRSHDWEHGRSHDWEHGSEHSRERGRGRGRGATWDDR